MEEAFPQPSNSNQKQGLETISKEEEEKKTPIIHVVKP